MKKVITFFLGLIVGCFIDYLVMEEKPPGIETETKEAYIDTIPYCAPKSQSELALGTLRYTLPAYRFLGGGAGGEPRQSGSNGDTCVEQRDILIVPAYGTGAGGEPRCSRDSVIVELSMIQRHYADSTYEAWVSGPIAPRLDSVRVFAPTTIITKREWKPPKRWHIGVTAGYGYGAKGFQPYIGVGITYSIFSF